MTKENAKDFEFISSKVNDHENGKLSRLDLIFDLMKYTEQLRLGAVVGKSEQLVCDCPDEKLWEIEGKIVCECGKYHEKKAN